MPNMTPENPLTRLISTRLEVRGLKAVDLRDRLRDLGVEVSKPAISRWLSGGGIHDRHRPAVAKALGISLLSIQRAAAERDKQLHSRTSQVRVAS